MRFQTIVSGAVLAGSCLAAPSNTHAVHEKRSLHSFEWSKQTRAAPHHKIPARIGLKQRNLEHGNRFLMDVADPKSPNFGKHWSATEVANMFAPSKESEDEVLKWLTAEGISRERISFSTGRNWVEFEATVGEMEQLLKTEYHLFEHSETGGNRLACDEYSLPHDVRKHIDFAMPTVQLDGMNPVADANVWRGASPPAYTGPTGLNGTNNCKELVTIDCLRALYDFPVANSSNPNNVMGIAEWADYLYLPDLAIFFENYTNPQIPCNVTPTFISIDGGKPSNLTEAQAGNVIESALDFQTAYSIIYPQNIRLYQLGDGVNVDSVGTFNIFLDALDASYCTYEGGDAPYVDPEYPDPNLGGYTGPLQCGGAPMSNVFSISYNQIEGALPIFYQERQCNEWMKLGLQGVSVLFASGDSGVANRYNSGYNNSCLNSENLYVDSNGTRFSPSFPVNCPYITSVGATQLATEDVNGGEVAVAVPDPSNPLNDFYSGGGFSNVFPLPDYQKDAVTNYLTKYPPGYGPNVYNQSGNARGYPDVSAIGINNTSVYLGETLPVGGTSASTPIVASIINLINEERLNAGKTALGFLNPFFYANPDAFNDITQGSNPGCGSNGFEAQPGWDPVTGLGTPNYQKLLSLAMALP